MALRDIHKIVSDMQKSSSTKKPLRKELRCESLEFYQNYFFIDKTIIAQYVCSIYRNQEMYYQNLREFRKGSIPSEKISRGLLFFQEFWIIIEKFEPLDSQGKL